MTHRTTHSPRSAATGHFDRATGASATRTAVATITTTTTTGTGTTGPGMWTRAAS